MRGRAGVFDVSHMGQLEVLGPGAFPYLQHRLSNDLDKIAAGGRAVHAADERARRRDRRPDRLPARGRLPARRQRGATCEAGRRRARRGARRVGRLGDAGGAGARCARAARHGDRAVRVPRGRGARHPLRRLRDRVHGRARVRAALRPRRRRGAVGSRARARRRSLRARRPRHAPARGVLPAARAGSHRGANADRGRPRLGLRAREGVSRRGRGCDASATRAPPSAWWRSPWRRRRSRARAWPCTKAAR